MAQKTTPQRRKNAPTPPSGVRVGVPFVCCQLAAICLMTGRPLEHAKDCTTLTRPRPS